MLKGKVFSENKKDTNKHRILLLGASVGKAWNLPEWPERMQNDNYIFEMIAIYLFDKSQALEEVLTRPKRKFRLTRTYLKSIFKPAPRKPDVIIIKECAGYFPGDINEYKALIEKWVSQCEEVDIKPVLTTVVSVTEEHSGRNPGRLQGILEYNDWVKEYIEGTGIGCLDFEAALRISEDNRALRYDLTSGDGLHLNKIAYDILDRELLETLNNLFKLTTK